MENNPQKQSPEILGGTSFENGVNIPSSRFAYERATRENLQIVLPRANELQIDIDNEDAEEVFTVLMNHLVPAFIGFSSVIKNPSKSGAPGKFHITVALNQDVTPLERIALQAILGSDRKRELLSFIELANGDKTPTLFLEKK